jgi:hypothetical protein
MTLQKGDHGRCIARVDHPGVLVIGNDPDVVVIKCVNSVNLEH